MEVAGHSKDHQVATLLKPADASEGEQGVHVPISRVCTYNNVYF